MGLGSLINAWEKLRRLGEAWVSWRSLGVLETLECLGEMEASWKSLTLFERR
jgi:hypothetical protein